MANLEYLDKQMKDLGVEPKKEDTPTLKDAAMFGAEFIPGVGEALAIKRTSDALDQKDYVGAGIEATAGLLGVIPGVGDLAGKSLRAATKSFRKADVDEAEKLIADPKKIDEWRSSNKLPESQRQKNIPEAAQAAEDLFQNKIKSKEARQKIKEVFPEPKLYTAETMPEMPTVTDVVGSMGKKSEKGILGVKGFDLEPGQRVGARLDIPAYNEYDKWVVSIHDGKSRNGSVVGYGQAIRLKNIEFGSDPKVALDIAKGKRVAKTTGEEKPMGKATIARVFGNYVPEDPYELQMFAKKVLAEKDSGWTQVGMNPYRGSYFYDKATGTPVTRADEVIQVGPLVLAKNVTKPKMSELKGMFNTPAARTADDKLRVFSEGGAVQMKEQMELFEPVTRGFNEGGLMQEGGTVDPVSGNDVPIGSTQEEVRDDIPAQLSEGEFVMPADVVRYHGLDKMMALRDEAKIGLQRMEDMGQMGNSDEAIIPEGVPFDINDLEMEDDGVQEFQVGGFVQQPFGVTTATPNPMQYQQSQFQNYVPQVTPLPTTTSAPYTAPTQQFTPVMQPRDLPTFEEAVVPTMVTYVNDAGAEIQIPVDKDGNPLIPVPDGFKKKTDATDTTTPPEETVIAPITQQPQQQDDGGGRDDMTPEEREKERQTFADISKRKDAAAKLGYTNQIGAFEHLAGALIPGVSLMNKYDAGDVMPDGTIADGQGNTFDPITGERKSVSGGLLGNIANEIAGVFGGGTKAEDAKISPEAKAMGLSPASMAGLMTIAGNQSINEAIGKPVLAGGMPPSKVETAKVETTLGQAAVTDETKAAQPATVSGAAQMSLQDKLSKMAKAGITADTFRDGALISEDAISPFAKDVLNEVRNSGVTMDTAFSRVAERYDVDDMGFPVAKLTTDELTFRDIESRQAAPSKTQDLVRAAVKASRRTPAQKTQDLVSSAARTSRRDRSQPSVQDTITREMSPDSGYSRSFERDIKAGKYDKAFAERDRFSRDLTAEIQKSERAEIASARNEGRSANVSSRKAGPGEVSDSQGNVVRSSDGSPVTSSGPTSSAKGLALKAEREQREADNTKDSRVICTELYKQGKLSRDLYRMDVLYTARDLPATLVRGYHYWAIPMVPVIRRNKFVCAVFEYLTVKRAEEIAHIVDPIKHTKTTIAGKIIKNVGEAICYVIGLFVRQKDYTVLYNEKSV